MNVTNILNINWDVIDPKFNFATMSALGSVMLFTERPEVVAPDRLHRGWWVPSIQDWGTFYDDNGEAYFNDILDWTQTLIERPVKVKVE